MSRDFAGVWETWSTWSFRLQVSPKQLRAWPILKLSMVWAKWSSEVPWWEDIYFKKGEFMLQAKRLLGEGHGGVWDPQSESSNPWHFVDELRGVGSLGVWPQRAREKWPPRARRSRFTWDPSMHHVNIVKCHIKCSRCKLSSWKLRHKVDLSGHECA